MVHFVSKRVLLVCCGLLSLTAAQFQFEFDGDFSDFFGGGGGGGGGDNQLKSSDLSDDADLYEILGLDEDASEKDVKKAYRKMTMKYHPDRNSGDEEAARKFREVAAAYEILGDSEKKILYDHGGMDLVKSGVPEEGGGGGGFGGIFGGLFGGGGGSSAKRGKTVNMETKISLEDFYSGKETSFTVKRRVVCRGCRGKKAKTKEKCKSCGRCPNEIKMVQRQMAPGFMVQQQEEVPSKEKCKQEKKELELIIERGAPEGTQIKFKHESDQKPGQIPGDIVVSLKQKKHPVFERKGDHLHASVTISLKEALLGFELTIDHLDGHKVDLGRDRVTRPFQTVVVKGEGMPVHEAPSTFGDLHVTYEVSFPKSLTAEQIDALKEVL